MGGVLQGMVFQGDGHIHASNTVSEDHTIGAEGERAEVAAEKGELY
jgi:hypothetical protein